MSDSKKELFDLIKENKDGIEWILTKQAELRAELLTFYKKDVKEIQSSLSTIDNSTTNEFGKNIMDKLHDNFINQWQRSYNLITPTLDENQ